MIQLTELQFARMIWDLASDINAEHRKDIDELLDESAWLEHRLDKLTDELNDALVEQRKKEGPPRD